MIFAQEIAWYLEITIAYATNATLPVFFRTRSLNEGLVEEAKS